VIHPLKRSLELVVAALALGAVIQTNGFAFQDPEDEGVSEEQAQDEKPAEPEKKEGESTETGAAKPKEPEEEHWFAVKGGDVHTGTGEFLRGATILAKNGKIEKIGYDLILPKDTKELDATGFQIYPGLVAFASVGLIGNAQSDFEDTIDPFNPRMVLGLAAGITTTGMGGSAVKLKRFSIDGAVLAEKIYTVLQWSNRSPRAKEELRQKFRVATEYLRQYREWEKKVKEDKTLAEPSKKNVEAPILAVIKGESIAKFDTNDRDELLGIARLAQEFGFRPAIEGCQEGWTIADELGRAGARAIVTPRERRPKDEQQAREGGASIENAALLHKAGVQVAIVPSNRGVDLGGIVGRDIMHLSTEAGFAVRGGMSDVAALQAITIVPARILGVSQRVGSLEVGKDCDLIVTDGDILHYKTFVQWAVVDGKIAYDKEKELFFAHIRPRPIQEPAEKKIDKGETAPKPEETPAKTEDKPDEDADKDEKTEEPKKDEDEPKRGH
jgi:hypothetical protein